MVLLSGKLSAMFDGLVFCGASISYAVLEV